MTFRRIFTRVVTRYKSGAAIMFSPKYLIFTNVILSSCMSTTGDLLEQSYEKYQKQIEKYDFYRTLHMSFSGAAAGVLCHHWYRFIDTVITGRTFDMVIKKLMLDQFIASPIIIMSFFATVAIFEENPWENFTEEVRDKFFILYKAEWTVWPPAQLINFYFLPTKYRVLYDNSISLGYDVYTSHVKHDKSYNKEKRKVNENSNENGDDVNNDTTKTEPD